MAAVGPPRTIWFLWLQGLENAPYTVRECHESWLARNPGWRVITLDEASLADFATQDYQSGNIARLRASHRADLLRLDLLAHHGGVWADATCFCVRPLDGWLPASLDSGFFAFSRPGPDRVISSWFLAADQENVLVRRLFDMMLSYWQTTALHSEDRQVIRKVLTRLLGRSPRTRAWWFSRPVKELLAVSPYFAIHYGFEKLIREDPECAAIWARTPKVSADGPHRLYRAGLLSTASPQLRAEIDRGDVPLYKTSWRVTGEDVPDDSLLHYLLQSGRH